MGRLVKAKVPGAPLPTLRARPSLRFDVSPELCCLNLSFDWNRGFNLDVTYSSSQNMIASATTSMSSNLAGGETAPLVSDPIRYASGILALPDVMAFLPAQPPSPAQVAAALSLSNPLSDQV